MAKILIIDDREDNIEILKELLKDGNYTIESASNGVEGLEKIEKDAPDLILMDAQMPKMDGFEMCKIVKENYRTRFIPVIMITVLSS
ncbi:MAG: response regulator, partial [Candidatus Omnitrophica bacterium]|nr:response regulator [Candidatus Omnitrophota bacterium]